MRVVAWTFFLLCSASVVTGCKCNQQPTKEELRAEGEPCTTDEQCDTGLCDVREGTATICIRKCATGCRNAEVCEPLAGDRHGCLPEKAGLCRTCQTDADCPYSGDKCITLGSEHFCGRDCAFDGTCPPTYRCAESTDIDGRAVPSQCQPTSGTCTCTATTAGQMVPCEVTNSFGHCIGTKTCNPPAGFTECSAHTPAAEACNGVDDNCNGQVDEQLGDLSCGQGECRRSAASCANGQPQACTPGTGVTETCNSKDDDCDGVVDNGFDLQSDVTQCGACGHVCLITNAVPRCDRGQCAIDHCVAGWSDLDHQVGNGCEYPCALTNGGVEQCDGVDNNCDGHVDEGFNLASDPLNCGQCNLACSVSGGTVASYACVARVCGIGACVTGRGNCDQAYGNGCEVDTTSDTSHCGACAHACVTPNATPACTASACAIGQCNPGYLDCNTTVTDGCEVHSTNDVNNCGMCGQHCTAANATSACVASACTFACQANWWDADHVASNGCEYACVQTNNGAEACDNIDNNCDGRIDETFTLDTDVNNCGACNHACSAPFASSACTARSCGILACNQGRADCDHAYLDGCEVNTTTDLNNCGGCGTVCNTPNATPSCQASTCRIQACNTGFRDCNTVVSDGCEVSVNTDLNNCGGCNNQCNLPHAVPSCTAGVCRVTSCLPGWWNLDGNDANGCEYSCVYTAGGLEVCDGLDNNCNGAIDEGFNLATDATNCGSCGHACSAPNVAAPYCLAGSCGVTACAQGYADCNGAFADGCERNTTNDVNNCSACGNACSTPNATPACQSSSCRIASCNAGWRDCDNVVANGCEVNPSTDVNNCGGCGVVCSFAHATPTCTGTCGFTCLPGYVDLDHNPANGCEYACTFLSSTDLPDPGFVDANCDGIDGEIPRAIFVAPAAAGGNDLNAGTMAAPKATVQAGVNAAIAQGKRDVLVAAGTYGGPVVLNAPNVGIYGAYQAGTWARASGNIVTVAGVNTPLTLSGANNATLQYLNFQGANATGVSTTAYGALVLNSVGVTLDHVAISAGHGTAGSSGTVGATGGAGANGLQGAPGCENSSGFCSSCGLPQGGAGGTSACGRTGGAGGAPGQGSSSGSTGGAGVGGTPGGPGTPSGQGDWGTPLAYWGVNGAGGAPGLDGSSAGGLGLFLSTGYGVAPTFGGTNGVDGNGGGGGGGGGGGTANCDSYGGAGSGGGAGGCAGGAGTAGTSGGASIGLYLWASTINSSACSVVTGNGGGGGNGAAGGVGGLGGTGGPRNNYGGGGEQDDGSNGGPGGSGGNGGNGGSGGAGGGGPTIAVLRAGGATWSAASVTYSTGTPGFGGLAPVGNGGVGIKQDVY